MQNIDVLKVLITGASGFIGRNLQLSLRERSEVEVLCFTRDDDVKQLPKLLEGVEFVFHLAGVNRPQNPEEFESGNADLTHDLCQAVEAAARSTGKRISTLFASSTQAEQDTAYGRSKLAAEGLLVTLGKNSQTPVYVFRLPNVFGKWCRPNYNSVVATFCHNISRGLPIQINDDNATLSLVYIDDVTRQFIECMDGELATTSPNRFVATQPQYQTTVGHLARQIQAFCDSRATLVTEPVGSGFVRALYATYISYLPVEDFSYEVPQYSDQRGDFVEMIKTPDCGQFSYFTAYPGVTRGGHYHQSKTEKFLVIKGQALFRFRNMQTGQMHELHTFGERPQVVDTIPGWAHDITNIGLDDLVVMIWANEIFDRSRPDTFNCPL